MKTFIVFVVKQKKEINKLEKLMSYQRGGENINQHNSKVKDTQRKFGVLE
jgi:hypothetical protein